MNIKTEAKKQFIQDFSQNLDLSPATTALLMDHFKYKKYPKDALVLQEGDSHPYAVYIVSGSAKMSTFKDDKERIIHLGEAGYILADLQSHFNQLPSQYEIAALDALEVIQFSMIELEELAYHDHGVAKFLYSIHKRGSVATQHRTKSLLTENSKERYQRFRITHPHCYQTLNDNIISKFLNISPQFMSKMKKEFNA